MFVLMYADVKIAAIVAAKIHPAKIAEKVCALRTILAYIVSAVRGSA